MYALDYRFHRAELSVGKCTNTIPKRDQMIDAEQIIKKGMNFFSSP
jgi:hypothetical protein